MRRLAIVLAGMATISGCGSGGGGAGATGGAGGEPSGGAGGRGGGSPGNGGAPAASGGNAAGGASGSGGTSGTPDAGSLGGTGGAAGGSGGAAPAADARPGDAASLPAAAPKTVVLDGRLLAEARQRLAAGDAPTRAALARLVALADAALTAGPWSVMDKTTTPPSGNKHDYISLARYWWPTPGAANGCPYIRKDGQTNPDTSTSKYDHASRHKAMDALYHLAMAWYYTGEAKYAMRAALVARTWFLDPATAMNPNVDYGEGVPCSKEGSDTGVLNWTEMIGQALDAIAVLDGGAPGWTGADQTAMRAWLTAFLKWLQTDPLATEEAGNTNNHGTWFDTGASAIMLYLGQTDAAKTLVQASTKRIASQIRADGQQPEELARTNGWGYSIWNLDGFCRLASTGRLVGVDLWAYTAPAGGSIARAADYLITAAKGGKAAWPHPQRDELQQSWAVPALHAAADFASDAAARAALTSVPAPAGGDLWPILPVCTSLAIQPD
jgi:hypothetical protein